MIIKRLWNDLKINKNIIFEFGNKNCNEYHLILYQG